MIRSSLAMLLALCAFPTAAVASDPLPCRKHSSGSGRPSIGLVLGGGGARGIAHVSVIRELERLQVPIDCIAGTSMGALVGGLYASGMPSADIETLVRTLDWNTVFDDALARPARSFRRKRDDDLGLLSAKPGVDGRGVKLASGLLAGESIMLLFERLTLPVATQHDFNTFPIPYRAIAADINAGDAVVLGSGNLAQAMRASMSIPGAFRPVRIGDRVLVDGGLVNQVPVDVVRTMGADIVIAVDVGTPLDKLDENSSVVSYLNQLSGFLTVGNTRKSLDSLGASDILIQPALEGQVATASFDKAADALRIGLEAVRPHEAALMALAQPGELRPRPERGYAPPRIDFVRIDNHTKYADEVLLAQLDFAAGQIFDPDRIEQGIKRIYGFDTLDTVTYEVVEDQGRTGLELIVRPRAFGPNYVETGMDLYSDLDSDFRLNLRFGVLRAPINRLGGELRGQVQLGSNHALRAEYYQPLDIRGRYFFGTKLFYEAPVVGLYSDAGDQIARYRLSGTGLDVYAGRELGRHGALLINMRRQQGDYDRLIGSPLLPQGEFNSGEASWGIVVDRLDSAQLPRDGMLLAVGQTFSRRALGADADYDQINLDYIGAKRFGASSISYGLRYHESRSGSPSFQSLYRLGGLNRLVGYRPGEFLAPSYSMAFVGYNREIGRFLGRSAIVGGSIESANVWGRLPFSYDDRDLLNASLYIGFDSWLGRILLGYGARQDGEGTLFLELGRTR